MGFRKTQLHTTTLIALWLFVVPPSHAETATDESIREFFVVSGQEAAMVENVQALLPALKQMMKDVPDDLFRELSRTDNVLTAITPIYRKYFSEEEMRELIALYKSPIGSKYAKLAGKLQRESAELGAKHAQMIVINYQVQKGQFKVTPPKQGN